MKMKLAEYSIREGAEIFLVDPPESVFLQVEEVENFGEVTETENLPEGDLDQFDLIQESCIDLVASTGENLLERAGSDEKTKEDKLSSVNEEKTKEEKLSSATVEEPKEEKLSSATVEKPKGEKLSLKSFTLKKRTYVHVPNSSSKSLRKLVKDRHKAEKSEKRFARKGPEQLQVVKIINSEQEARNFLSNHKRFVMILVSQSLDDVTKVCSAASGALELPFAITFEQALAEVLVGTESSNSHCFVDGSKIKVFGAEVLNEMKLIKFLKGCMGINDSQGLK